MHTCTPCRRLAPKLSMPTAVRAHAKPPCNRATDAAADQNAHPSAPACQRRHDNQRPRAAAKRAALLSTLRNLQKKSAIGLQDQGLRGDELHGAAVEDRLQPTSAACPYRPHTWECPWAMGLGL